jgi:hypothetical protein
MLIRYKYKILWNPNYMQQGYMEYVVIYLFH